MRLSFSHLATPVAILSLPLAVSAAEVWYDDGGVDTDWTTILNWSNDLQPTAADRVNINGGFTTLITSDVGTIDSLRIGLNGNSSDGNGTLVIDGGQLVVSDGAQAGQDVFLGLNGRTGTLRILNGGVFTSDFASNDGQIFLGSNGTTTGIVEVTEGTLNADRGFFVGGDTTGTDRVNATGTATIGDGSGSADSILNVNRANLELGYGGVGTLTLESDGEINQLSNNFVIGQGAASDGTFIMNGGAVNIHPNGDLNLNSGTQLVTINDGTFIVRQINMNALEGKVSTMNLNGGFIDVSANFVDRDGTSIVNYNGSRVEVAGGTFSTDFFSIGTDSVVDTDVTFNLVSATTTGDEFFANTVTIKQGLSIGSAGVTATANLDNGFVSVDRGIGTGGGTSALNLGVNSAAQLRIDGVNPLGDLGSRIGTLTVGANGTLTARPNAFGVNAIETTNANLTGGTLTMDMGSLGAGSNAAVGQETAWLGGSAEWGSGNADWTRGDPAGYSVAANINMTVIDSTNPVVGTINLTTAGWTLQDDGTVSGQVVVSNDTGYDVGTRRAVLEGSGATVANVTRSSDLIISNSIAAGTVGTPDAAHLQTRSNSTLTVGTTIANANVYVGGAGNGTVDQRGDVTIHGDLFFGQNPAGGDNGGTWNVFPGATLTVSGEIKEQAVSTNNAQLYLRGGTMDVGGNVTVQRFDVAGGGSQNTDYTLPAGQVITSTGTTQIGGASRGRIYLDDAGSKLAAANMTIGAGNNSRESRLEVSAGIAGTFGGNLTLGTNASGNTGARIVVDGTGTVRVSANGNIDNPASGAANLLVNSGRTMEVSVRDSGTLDIGQDFNLHNSTATASGTHLLNVNLEDSGTLNVGRDLNYRSGTSTVAITGGTLSVGRDVLLNAGTGVFRVDGANSTINVTQNFTQTAGQSLEFGINGNGISPIVVGTTGIVDLAGDIDVDASGLTTPGSAAASLTTWNVGAGTWTTSDAEWLTGGGAMLNPDGITVTSGSRFTVFDASSGAAFGASVPTVNTANWSFDNTADPNKGDLVYSGADIVGLPINAELDDAAAPNATTVTRATDLQVAPEVGADAGQLTIQDGVTFDITDGGTDPNLIVGSGTVVGVVNQNGGTVNIDGALVFGTGASTFGGTYNLNGGSLNVGGDVVEGSVGGGVDTSVDNAQLYINGGTLNVTGTNIDVQSLRVGQAAGSNANVTLTDKVVASSGESHVGDDNGSVGVLNLLGTTDYTSGGAFFIGGDTGSDGTLNVGDGSDNPMLAMGGTSDLEIGPNGTGRLNLLSGTLNAPGGIDVAAGTGGTGFFVIGDGTSTPTLNVINGNLESAVAGTGTVTMKSGTYNQNSNNLIVGQGGTSNGTFNMEGGEVNINPGGIRIANGGTGFFNQTGGVVNVNAAVDSGAFNNNSVATLQVSGGTLNANGGISLALQPGAMSTFNLSGTGVVNVEGTGGEPRALNLGQLGTTIANISGGDLNVAGETTVGRTGNGTLNITGVDSGKEHNFAAVLVGRENNATSIGAVTIDMANSGDVVNMGAVNNGNGGLATFNLIEGTLNVTGFANAQGAGSSAANGRTATVVIGGTSGENPTLNVSTTNFETAANGTGIVTMKSGTYNQTGANLIVGQTSTANGTFNMEGGDANITNLIRVGNSAGGTGTLNISGGTMDGGTIDFGANGGTGSTHELNLSGGALTVGGFTVATGSNTISLTGGTLNATNMNLHNSAADGSSNIQIGGSAVVNVSNNLDYRTGFTDLSIGGTADVNLGNVLFNAGGSGANPNTFAVVGNTASIDLTGNFTMTGTDQRELTFQALSASAQPTSTVMVGGNLTAAGTLNLLDWNTLFTSAFDIGQTTLFDYSGTFSGQFIDKLDGSAWADGEFWNHTFADNSTLQLFYEGGDGTDVVLVPVNIPEPSRLVLFGLGLASLILRRRR